jgi:TetR/AcrR family transcriptional regulator
VTRTAIARQAGVAASLVGYYFANTDGLLLEAAVSMWRDLRQRSHAAVARATSPADKLFVRTRVLLETHVENRYFNQLVIEHMLRGTSVRARQATDELVQDSFAELSDILKAGVDAGEFRPTDPIFLYETMLGACETFAASQRHLQMLLRGKKFDEKLIGAYARFLCDLVLEGIGVSSRLPTGRRARPLSVA